MTKFSDLPEEIKEVKALISINQGTIPGTSPLPFGKKLLQYIQDTVDKYPEYFPEMKKQKDSEQ